MRQSQGNAGWTFLFSLLTFSYRCPLIGSILPFDAVRNKYGTVIEGII